MHTRLEQPAAAGPAYVSTGHLPPPEQVRALVAEAYERYQATAEGENSQVYPALARVPRELFGICVVGTRGNVYAVGDADCEFTIMSVSKPFVFALVCQAVGVEEVCQCGVDEPDGECGGHCHDQPGAGRDSCGPMVVHP